MSEKTGGSKPQRESATGSTASENRKLRNRLSQKAFRARQSVYIKELERRLEDASKSETERNADLEDRNKFYRDQLLESHKKLESLQVSLQAVLDSVAGALGLQTSNAASSQAAEDIAQQRRATTHSSSDSHTSQLLQAAPQVSVEGSIDDLDFDEMFAYQTQQPNIIAPVVEEEGFDVARTIGNPVDVSSNLGGPSASMEIMPPSLAYTYQDMGDAYKNIPSSGPVLMNTPTGLVHGTNSLFSDHIASLEHLMKQKLLRPDSLMSRRDSNLSNSAAFMISMFVSTSWNRMSAFYDYTRALDEIYKLTTWRVNPTKTNYSKLAPNYRPTQLQVSLTHPSIIDWAPFPSIRDKLILYHAGNPRLDEIICDLGLAYVVEANLADLVTGLGEVRCYLTVWDLTDAIATSNDDRFPNAVNPDPRFSTPPSARGYALLPETRRSSESSLSPEERANHFAPSLPAPSIDALFMSSSLALAAFKFLGMDRGAAAYRLDPIFFEKHPELFDSKENLMARGVPIRPTNRAAFPRVGPLNSSVLNQYDDYAAWTMDANGHWGSGNAMGKPSGVQAC